MLLEHAQFHLLLFTEAKHQEYDNTANFPLAREGVLSIIQVYEFMFDKQNHILYNTFENKQ